MTRDVDERRMSDWSAASIEHMSSSSSSSSSSTVTLRSTGSCDEAYSGQTMSLDRAADPTAASSLCLRHGGRRSSCSVMMSADQLAQGDVADQQMTHSNEDLSARSNELQLDTTTNDGIEESQLPSPVTGNCRILILSTSVHVPRPHPRMLRSRHDCAIDWTISRL